MTRYVVPVFVYKNPNNSTEGELMAWELSKAQKDTLVSISAYAPLTNYDLLVTTKKKGFGREISFSSLPNQSLRMSMPSQQIEELNKEVNQFFLTAEYTLVRRMSEDDYKEMYHVLNIPLPFSAPPGRFVSNAPTVGLNGQPYQQSQFGHQTGQVPQLGTRQFNQIQQGAPAQQNFAPIQNIVVGQQPAHVHQAVPHSSIQNPAVSVPFAQTQPFAGGSPVPNVVSPTEMIGADELNSLIDS